MKRRTSHSASIFFLLAALSQVVFAYDFIFYTQNMLRFGHGSRLQTQCEVLNAQMKEVDIAVLQEVMRDQPALGCILPGDVTWQALGPFGQGSYKEYYVAISRNTARSNGPTVIATQFSYTSTQPGYMRPPVAWVFDVGYSWSPSFKRVLIADFHAIWGRSVSQRRAEVTKVADFYNYLKSVSINNQPVPSKGNNVLFGGDWNLPSDDSGFDALREAQAIIMPNIPSSLTANGMPSQAYDHFVHTPDITLAGDLFPEAGWGGPACNTGNWICWRRYVSDHRGIVAEVNLP